MKTPTVSVIMPAYNHEKYVGEAIESVLNQTFTDFEFIIINDGSTDGTDRVIRSYDDPRIRYYTQENLGAHNTLNRGLSLAKGKYISIINSDDVYHLERLSRLIEAAEAQDVRFIITDVVFIDEFSTPIKDPLTWHIPWFSGLKSTYLNTRSLEKTFLLGNIATTTSNFFFHSEAVEEIGLFNSYRYAHDYDFALRALLRYRGKFLFLVDNQYLFYRLHAKNTIRESALALNTETVSLLIKMIPEFIRSKEDKARVEAALKNIEQVNSHILQEIKNREDILNTMSWRLTAPLRWLYGKYLKVMKNF